MLPGNLLDHHGEQYGFRVANHQSSPEEPWLWPASSLSERRELNRDGVGKGLGVHQEAKQSQSIGHGPCVQRALGSTECSSSAPPHKSPHEAGVGGTKSPAVTAWKTPFLCVGAGSPALKGLPCCQGGRTSPQVRQNPSALLALSYVRGAPLQLHLPPFSLHILQPH